MCKSDPAAIPEELVRECRDTLALNAEDGDDTFLRCTCDDCMKAMLAVAASHYAADRERLREALRQAEEVCRRRSEKADAAGAGAEICRKAVAEIRRAALSGAAPPPEEPT